MKDIISNLKDGKEKESYEILSKLTQDQFWEVIGSEKFDKKIQRHTRRTINDWWKSPIIISIALGILSIMVTISGFFFFSVLRLNDITIRTQANIEKLSETVNHLELEIQDKLSSIDREVIRLRDRLEK